MTARRRLCFRCGAFLLVLSVVLIALGSCSKKTEDRVARDSAPARELGQVEAEEGLDAETPSPGQTLTLPGGRVPATEEESQPPRRSGRKAPDFALANLDGQTVRLSDFRGRIVLIDFWATWCRPCLMEIPHLIELYNEYGRDGFAVVGISVDQKGESVVRPFVKRMAIPYPIVMGNPTIVHKYGPIRGIPTAFLVDAEGYIVAKYEGYREKSVFESEIRRLLSQGPET